MTICEGTISFSLVKRNWKVSTIPYWEGFYWLMRDKQVVDLINDIRENGIKEPIVLGTGGFILEGRHRFCIADMLRIEEIPFIFEDKPPDLKELDRIIFNHAKIEKDYR
jgi:hypothetical protein